MSIAVRPLDEALAALHDVRAEIAARNEPTFHARLAELRDWQTAHVAAYHTELATTYNADALLDFLTQRFYRDADWSELTGRPQKVARAINRIVEYDRPLVIAIELQAAAEKLDIAVVDALLAEGASINPFSYVRAFRRADRREIRLQQIRWLEELVTLITGYAESRAAWWTFRLARTPAHAVGLGKTYDLLAEGFTAMRAVHDLQTGAREAVTAQYALLDRLLEPTVKDRSRPY